MSRQSLILASKLISKYDSSDSEIARIQQIYRTAIKVETQLLHFCVNFEDVRNFGIKDDPFLLLVDRYEDVVMVRTVHDEVKTNFDYLHCAFIVLI